jgi:hypothetical protein
MAQDVETKEIENSVAMVNDEIAVGSDLDFQRRWWRFERILWSVLTVIVILDALGFFGRGWFAKAEANTADGSMHIQYERIERFGAPSLLTIHFGQSAVRNGAIELWASDSLLHELGTQRVIPQADRSQLDGRGIVYRWIAAPQPDSIQFSMQPAKVGVAWLTLRAAGGDEMRLKIIIFP